MTQDLKNININNGEVTIDFDSSVWEAAKSLKAETDLGIYIFCALSSPGISPYE